MKTETVLSFWREEEPREKVESSKDNNILAKGSLSRIKTRRFLFFLIFPLYPRQPAKEIL